MTEKDFLNLNKKIVNCERCPKLRQYCTQIAIEKKRQFSGDVYWGKPVPSFGDPQAGLLIVGLAPAAHGANRTGRMFTGDNSGLWLYRALYRAGFANQEKSVSSRDDLRLIGAYITAAIHCAPPDNKPTPDELENCAVFLREEFENLKNVRVILVLGQIGLRAFWKNCPAEWKLQKSLPKFSHGMEVQLAGGRVLMGSYHPSQQNTFTKRLTEKMLDQIFVRTRELLTESIV